jgi:hypothetical protein
MMMGDMMGDRCAMTNILYLAWISTNGASLENRGGNAKHHARDTRQRWKSKTSGLWFQKKTVDASSTSTVPALLLTLLTTGGWWAAFAAVMVR